MTINRLIELARTYSDETAFAVIRKCLGKFEINDDVALESLNEVLGKPPTTPPTAEQLDLQAKPEPTA